MTARARSPARVESAMSLEVATVFRVACRSAAAASLLVCGGCDGLIGLGEPADAGGAPADGSRDHASADAATDSADAGYDAGCAPDHDGSEDPENCGRCGHSCQGGACSKSTCQPLQLSALAPSGCIAVDATHVYFADGECPPYGPCKGNVLRVPVGGGFVSTLATLPLDVNCQGMAVDAENVYLTNIGSGDSTGTVLSVPIAGGVVHTLASAQAAPWAIAIDSTSVYWTNAAPDAGAVVKIAIDGGSPHTLASNNISPQAIAVDTSSVYWTQWALYAPVLKVPVDGGAISTLANNQCDPAGIAVRGSNVYWAQNCGIHPGGAGYPILSVSIDGGSSTPLTKDQIFAFAVAVDATHVYWSLYEGAFGAIVVAPLSGGAAQTLASNQGSAKFMALNSSAIFWTTAGGVMMVAKP